MHFFLISSRKADIHCEKLLMVIYNAAISVCLNVQVLQTVFTILMLIFSAENSLAVVLKVV